MDAPEDAVTECALRLGDNCLILGQRLAEWCGHAPVLEEDIALTNTALDLIGHARLWYGLACATPDGSVDDIAFLRDVRAFRNCLIVEQGDDDYALTIMRQFLFDVWHLLILEDLCGSSDRRIVEIAGKAVKEVRYHKERTTDLVIRLGDGSPESAGRMQAALDALWPFTGEMTTPDQKDDQIADHGLTSRIETLRPAYEESARAVLEAARLVPPEETVMRTGGKRGLHSERFGRLIAEMQWLQRAYPGAQW